MKVVLAALLASCTFATGAAAAQYAAIAFAQSNGNYGYSNRASSRGAAEDRALQECGPGCEVVIWARDACAVLVTGDGNGYGVFWSADEDSAVSGALGECEARTSGCQLAAMVCAGY
jgi:hypothetical protein